MRYIVGVSRGGQFDPATANFYYCFNGGELVINQLDRNEEYVAVCYLVGGGHSFDYEYLCQEIELGSFQTLSAPPSDRDGDGIPDSCDPDSNDGPLGDFDYDGIPNQDDNDVPPLIPEMPKLECGKSQPVDHIDPNSLLPFADSGMIFIINTFPILVQTVSGGSGLFSGTGVIGLPFKDANYLQVSFENIKVTTEFQIIEGEVLGVSDPNMPISLLDLDTISIGEERFCKEDLEDGMQNGVNSSTNGGANHLGFDENGNYVAPPYDNPSQGMLYDPKHDPRGFSADGVHVVTGTLYNEFGCDQQQLDSLKNPCLQNAGVEYYWLDSTSTAGSITPEGQALYNTVKDTIKPMLLIVFDSMKVALKGLRDAKGIECNLIRDTMNVNYNILGYDIEDRPFVYGPDDAWYKPKMYQEFERIPQELGINGDRPTAEVELEHQHVQLFHCDRTLQHHVIKYELVRDELSVDPELDYFVNALKERIKRLPAAKVNAITSSPGGLHNWLVEQADSLLLVRFNQKIPDNGIGAATPKRNQQSNPLYQTIPYQNAMDHMSYMATIGDELIVGRGYSAEQRTEFEYKQGWQTVNGVDRAFYLEAAAAYGNGVARPPAGKDFDIKYMPLKISKEILGKTYAIYLDQLVFTPDEANVDVYAIVNTTPSPDRIVFKALGVSLDASGFKGPNRLQLGTDIQVTISNSMRMHIHASDSTFVAFDCDGFAGMGVEAELQFCRKYITPLHPQTMLPLPEPALATTKFVVTMPAWGFFEATVFMDPFAVTGHEEFRLYEKLYG